MNRTHRASYTAIHPQIVHTLNASNLRRSRPLRRSVSNLMRYSCRSVPQSTPVHPQIEHTLNASNLRRSRPSRRSVSNLLSYSCRSVPQSTPGTPKTKSRAFYSLRGPTIWREGSTVFTSVRCMRQAFTGPHLSRPRPYGKRASRALVPSLTLLQRFLVGDSDFRYFEDGRHFEDGGVATPHSLLR